MPRCESNNWISKWRHIWIKKIESRNKMLIQIFFNLKRLRMTSLLKIFIILWPANRIWQDGLDVFRVWYYLFELKEKNTWGKFSDWGRQSGFSQKYDVTLYIRGLLFPTQRIHSYSVNYKMKNLKLRGRIWRHTYCLDWRCS